jgi:leucyl-tRNA---protein transferase
MAGRFKCFILGFMFAQVHFPQIIKPDELDHYLADGWFRMGQTIFTTNFLNFKNQFYSAVWLRINLTEWQPTKAQLKLRKQNAHFRIEISKACLTPEKEYLFAKYKKSVDFEASASLNQLLYGKGTYDVYNTFEVNIFDGQQLVAIGYFDLGKESAAGISSFYDPDYKKFSLGKYLIFLKMEYCKKTGLQYFYPGYFVPGYSAFDYKLQLSTSSEFFQFASQQWISIDHFENEHTPLQNMYAKLKALQVLLLQFAIGNKLYRYEFFDANLIPDLNGLELFDFPIFLSCSASETDVVYPILIYDIRNHQYHLIKCRSIWPSKLESDQPDVYCTHLLKIEQYVFSSESAREIVKVMVSESISG